MHDAIVVGGGPGGATAARELAKAGLDVLIVERETIPRDKACGGIGTYGLYDLVGPELDQVVEQKVDRTAFYLNMKHVIEYDDPDILFKRINLDRLLVDLAVEEGAGLMDGAPVAGVNNRRDRYAEVKLEGGEVLRARVVVGADGPYSTVAKSAGLFIPVRRRRGNFAIYFEEDVPRDEVDALLGPLEASLRLSYFWRGFLGMGWVFRKEGGLNVGIGVHNMGRSDLKRRADDFLEVLGLGRYKDRLRGYHIPGRFLPRISAERVLLVGDAAGAANPSTGCGIEEAIKTGILAARTITRLHGRGHDLHAHGLHAYDRSLGTLRRMQRMRLRVLDIVNACQRRGLDTQYWMSFGLKTMVKFDLERFIWTDATRY